MSKAASVSRGPRAGSFSGQVLDLSHGESASRVKLVDPSMTFARASEELPSLRQQFRNAVTPAATRAREATGATYNIEIGDVQMPGGRLYLVAVVTRNDVR